MELRRIAIFPPKNDLILNREKWNIGYSLEINFSIKTNIMIRDKPPKVNKNIIKILRKNADECEEQYHDMGTNDFLIGIMEKHEKMAWMLRAHLEQD